MVTLKDLSLGNGAKVTLQQALDIILDTVPESCRTKPLRQYKDPTPEDLKNGWNHISNAPRDGTEILIAVPSGALYRSVWEFVETSDWDGKEIYDFYLLDHDDWFGTMISDGPFEYSNAIWRRKLDIPEFHKTDEVADTYHDISDNWDNEGGFIV